MSIYDPIKEVFTLCYNNRDTKGVEQIVPALVGHTGIGKTQFHQQFAEENEFDRFELVSCGQLSEPGDLLGAPYRDVKTNKMLYAKPYWLPTHEEESVYILFDELNRANSLVQQALLPVLLERKLLEHKIPSNAFVTTGINPPTENDEYMVSELDKALADRLLYINFPVNLYAWLDYLTKQEVDKTLLMAFENNPSMFNDSFETNLRTGPSRRSAHMFASLYHKDLSTEVVQLIGYGLLGKEITASLIKDIKVEEGKRPFSGKDLLRRFPVFKGKFENWCQHPDMFGAEILASYDQLGAYMQYLNQQSQLTGEDKKTLKTIKEMIPEELLSISKMTESFDENSVESV